MSYPCVRDLMKNQSKFTLNCNVNKDLSKYTCICFDFVIGKHVRMRKLSYPGTCKSKINMAATGEGGGKEEVKTNFVTREGTYRLMPLSEYSKPTRVPYNGQTNTPCKVTFVDLDDGSGTSDRICFNVGRELYFYVYKGVRKVSVCPIISHHT